MELKLTERGDVISELANALASRHLELKDGAHPNQVFAARWRQLSSGLKAVVDELEALRFSGKREPKIDEYFRLLTYQATEVLDAYAQLLVASLGSPAAGSKPKFRDYQQTIKRLRDPWALICNKFKHAGAQLGLIQCTTPGVHSTRFLLLKYQGGDALVRDDQVHKGIPMGRCFVRATQELVHAVLRADYQATAFVRSLDNTTTAAARESKSTLPIGDSLWRLANLQATVTPQESDRYDGLQIVKDSVRLVRAEARRLPREAKFRTTLTGDGHTSTFSFI